MVTYSSRRKRHSKASSRLFLYSKIAKYSFFGLVALVILVFGLFLWYGRNLPTPGKLAAAQLSDSTKIYDRNNVLLYSVYADQNRTYAKLSEIPKNLQFATISVEDKNFYKNEGFSLTGYVRAFFNIITLHGIQGGSTLSQQLVKNVLLGDTRQVLSRKIKELILSIQVNKRYSKDQILEMYLNDVGYGGAAVGVEAASETYFGKTVGKLDLAESAFLAGLPQSPTTYSPFSGNKYYLTRTDVVLQEMVRDGYISETQHKKAISEIKAKQFSQQNATIKAPHFVMWVKQLLAQRFGDQMVENGGLKVQTTLNYSLQQKAEGIVKDQIDKLKRLHVSNGAAIVTDPKTGEIMALVGSKDYFDTSNDGNFNVAISNNRQPGSSLKPVMYATALERGYTASTLIMDTKTDFPSGDGSMYTPVNYDGKFHGPVELRYALANSFNITAVKMLAKVGLKPVMQKGFDMGIDEWNPTPTTMAHVGLSLVLGGQETSLLHEVTAYGVFANEGVRHDLVAIQSVEDEKGNVLYKNQETSGIQVLSKGVAYIISNILSDNDARTPEFGPRSALYIPGKTVSVKTGTTDEKRDNWTIGYTPSYVVGVWVGNNDNSPMSPVLASGITGAAPIWNNIMSEVLKGKNDEPEPKPDTVADVTIDAFAGGLPHGDRPKRSELFVKGTEPTSESPIYKAKDGKEYYVFHEDDPVSTDGKNRWQDGIDAWMQTMKADEHYNIPDELKNQNNSSSNSGSPTPTPSPTPGS